ncbi:hypothetical protein KIH27_05945 [Mycobacterium sp. M1]|uniref:Ferredoxin n=1 Tax=Mycolicibacter acidiphilus TaxID=2835306 RepID=A0ABS5RFT1_9MYCO|nr:hypothetical protein [Mycolicibacter acidiphilus]MBS9533131.1 hypothetical protein [Mycolicibacter acidiphilus]
MTDRAQPAAVGGHIHEPAGVEIQARNVEFDDHRDNLLTADERARGDMLICISRACGDHLTIDR